MNTVLKTEAQIRLVKHLFADALAQALNLHPISAPLMVLTGTGINDDLNGVERSVQFPVKFLGDRQAVVVNSLAKWKRLRLAELHFPPGEGILTDMRAIRPDEDYSPLHSVYVDQWDWEKVIEPGARSLTTLQEEVCKIYGALRFTAARLAESYPELERELPAEITFVQSEKLRQRFPDLSPKERENEICREYGAVFLIGIGGPLGDGQPHDGRSPDYDDWSTPAGEGFYGLNGDILVWNPVLESALELSSMGIRVDAPALTRQLEQRGQQERSGLMFHRLLLEGKLPQTIGGGIGQSRVCMFLLNKRHIGEVQASVWPDETGAELL
ncbi:aspartate--ammonia ligase [Deinococcus lacus]|uniref:Aspartate--ammonia ligase n=1 Tax=Deinococcus lacus TaxID=392561 RepID=A0ABW1YBE2_9DEIO